MFEEELLRFFGGLDSASWIVDRIMKEIANNNLFKGGVFVVLLAYFYYSNPSESSAAGRKLFLFALGTVPMIVFVRLLSEVLPFRLRPIHQPGVADWFAAGYQGGMLDEMSAFPSDHAAMFTFLAIGFFAVSRRVGLGMILYDIFFIMLPRIFLGYHHATDLLAGAAIGVACGLPLLLCRRTDRISDRIDAFGTKHPGVFHAGFILLLCMVFSLFQDLRAAASAVLRLLSRFP